MGWGFWRGWRGCELKNVVLGVIVFDGSIGLNHLIVFESSLSAFSFLQGKCTLGMHYPSWSPILGLGVTVDKGRTKSSSTECSRRSVLAT